MALTVRRARPSDAGVIHAFVHELAAYERLSHAAQASEADLADALFCDVPRVFCDIAEAEGEPVGFALWFYTFSTFLGRHGVYLEDLYVRPAARGHGAGRALLQALARRCADEGLGRLEWAVLDWNAPAIAFYDALDAATLGEWITRRLDGAALQALADG